MQEERKMILKMIEEGKISAEEGLQLLNALKEDKQEGPKQDYTKNADHGEGSVSREVDWEQGSSYRQKYREKSPSFAARFTEFIEDAVQKIKEFDLDFNFGSSVEIQHTFQHRDAIIEYLDVSVENGNITLKPWDEEDIRVECAVKVYKVRDTDEARRLFLDEVVFDVTNNRLRFMSGRKTMKVNTVLYVPKKDLEKIKLYTFNGKISGDKIPGKKFEAQTVNGRIGFEEINAEEVRLETVNGTISVGKLTAAHCDTKTVNGTIAITGNSRELEAETLNGTVNYTLLEPESSKAYIKTTTGSVMIHVPEDVKTEGELKSTVGGIHCDLPQLTVIEEKKEFASKSMAFLANKNGERSFYIEAEATTGSITVRN
jgi:DUF4097 and DUF4098 domain-containing protein YvlB